MRKAQLLVLAGVLLVAAACGDDGGTTNESLGIPDPTASPGISVQTDHNAGHGGGAATTCTATSGKRAITAQGAKFDHHCLAGPANTPFTITFSNQDTAAYNVAIFRSHSDVQPLFRGELFAGPGTVTYNVPALPPGEYAFHSEAATTQLGHGTLVIG